MRYCTYTEGEIVNSYRLAKDRTEQIKILSDLNLCDRNDIIDILNKYGFNLPHITKTRKYLRWSKKEEQTLITLFDEGRTYGEIAKLLGRNSEAIRARRNKILGKN